MVRDFDRNVEVVLKIAERCNINCTYCYMFNKTSDAYLDKPKLMSLAAAERIADFLLAAVESGDVDGVRIIFHGGEPTMMPKRRFAAICDMFKAKLDACCRLKFTIQTNAILIDEAWMDIFSHYQIDVGVSLDGPEEVNDIDRLDHQGRGTYRRVRAGIDRMMNRAHQTGRPGPGLLCVINPAQDGGEMLDHFARDIGVNSIDFLLPMETWDSIGDMSLDGLGDFLISAFDRWVELDDERVSVRFFENFYTFMTGVTRSRQASARPQDYVIVSISSDGSFGPDDALRVAGDDLFEFDVATHTLGDYLNSAQLRALTDASVAAPAECSDCAWKTYCKGGSANGRVINRYAEASGFDRKSVLCPALRRIYAHMARYMVSQGYPQDKMIERLAG